MKKHFAFTLIELIIALAIVLIAVSVTAVSYRFENADKQIQYEAESLSHWFSERMALADSFSASWTLYISYGDNNERNLRLQWNTGPMCGKYERYELATACRLMEVSGTSGSTVYSGEWHTMTPALTVTVYPPEGMTAQKYRKVVVSGQGYVSIQ